MRIEEVLIILFAASYDYVNIQGTRFAAYKGQNRNNPKFAFLDNLGGIQ